MTALKKVSPVVTSAEQAAIDVLEGTSARRGLRRFLPFMGPAFVACVAYIDPGNFATNIAAGAEFGYNLLWVVVYANIMAMLIQTLSAKLGIATGQNLPEMMRAHFPSWLVWPLWILAEIMAMATDLAEFTGAAVGFNLLFGMPLLLAACLTGISTFCMLYLATAGFPATRSAYHSLRPRRRRLLRGRTLPWPPRSQSDGIPCPRAFHCR